MVPLVQADCERSHSYLSFPLPFPSVDLLTLRAAAGGGSIDAIPAPALVAAGFTLLQRSPALVRALAGRRAAVLLPNSPQYLVALAASEGRGALLVDAAAPADEVARQLRAANAGAVFTTAERAAKVPPGLVQVLLDDVPRSALVRADGREARVDLGSHFGLELEGDEEAAGRDEECVVTVAPDGTVAALTHRELITRSRLALQQAGFAPTDRVESAHPFSDPAVLAARCIAPLLAGATVATGRG